MKEHKHSKVRTKPSQELTVHLSSVVQLSLQGSHKRMAKSILKPFWSPFEIKLTFVKANRGETSINLKKLLPSGIVLKKINDLPHGIENYRELIIPRLPGQSISIYPANDVIDVQELLKDFFISPYKEIDENDRRRSPIVKFKVWIPESWAVSTYENSTASERKVEGKDISNDIQKIYAAMLAGEDINDRVKETLEWFRSTYGSDGEAGITEADLMPAHRLGYISLKLLDLIGKEKV